MNICPGVPYSQGETWEREVQSPISGGQDAQHWGWVHGQTSLPHTHRLDTTQLLRTECQHATTNLPAPLLHARRQKTTAPDHALPAATSSAATELCLQGLSHPEPDHASWSGLAAQRARPAKQLLENASGAAAPQKGSSASRSAPAQHPLLQSTRCCSKSASPALPPACGETRQEGKGTAQT